MAKELLRVLSDRQSCLGLVQRLAKEAKTAFSFMEVCGTHTAAIFQSGLRSLLPDKITHVSGPGCPVCVTHPGEIEACLQLVQKQRIILATFGDMIRVPGPEGGSLNTALSGGARIKVCYSPMEALNIARENSSYRVVFVAVGFETTAPAVAATVKRAREINLGNFYILSCHKLIPPAIRHLLQGNRTPVNGFLLPGHVSTIIGLDPYRFIAEQYKLPAVVAGFEPSDIVLALHMMIRMHNSASPALANQYSRAVSREGNSRALSLMYEVFQVVDARWRGLGTIKGSGLELLPEFSDFDAKKAFNLFYRQVSDPPGCRCGEVLQGMLRPVQCSLFGKICTPSSPVGPCMVSTEGSCAAYFKYGIEEKTI